MALLNNFRRFGFRPERLRRRRPRLGGRRPAHQHPGHGRRAARGGQAAGALSRPGEEAPEQLPRHGYAQPIGRDDQADEDADGKSLDEQVQPEVSAAPYLPGDGVCRWDLFAFGEAQILSYPFSKDGQRGFSRKSDPFSSSDGTPEGCALSAISGHFPIGLRFVVYYTSSVFGGAQGAFFVAGALPIV